METEMSEIKVGDLVVPTEETKQSFRFNKNAKLPWKVTRIKNQMLWLERVSRTGKPYIDKWHISMFRIFVPEKSKGANK